MRKLFFLFAAVLAIVACEKEASKQSVDNPIVVESVVVTPATQELLIGESCTLSVAVTPAELADKVEWVSTNSDVAAVVDGTVTAVRPVLAF
ncbi:MAG: Ig-like domain-containing protein [Alistipes sp.]|nr:Ig-like domain-containing protein [Alistipes sp.]